jgi:hypothetical protein
MWMANASLLAAALLVVWWRSRGPGAIDEHRASGEPMLRERLPFA